jgi:hypothetical protein
VGLARRQRAIDKAIDKIQDRKINLSQAFAERKQVVNSIEDAAKRLARAIVAVRRRDRNGFMDALGLTKRPKRFTGNVSKDWLAAQYGWLPLLSDIRSGAELLAQQQFERPLLLVGRGKAEEILPSYRGEGKQDSLSAPVLFVFSERKLTTKCKLVFSLENDLTRVLTDTGILDPLLLAWELLPYSFVVDWFLPVGKFLERLNYDNGLNFVKGSVVHHSYQESEVQGISRLAIRGDGRHDDYDGGKVVYDCRRIEREVLLTAPRVALPRFKDPLSVTHALNALALMRGAFGR